jgi:hypothetical protein
MMMPITIYKLGVLAVFLRDTCRLSWKNNENCSRCISTCPFLLLYPMTEPSPLTRSIEDKLLKIMVAGRCYVDYLAASQRLE